MVKEDGEEGKLLLLRAELLYEFLSWDHYELALLPTWELPLRGVPAHRLSTPLLSHISTHFFRCPKLFEEVRPLVEALNQFLKLRQFLERERLFDVFDICNLNAGVRHGVGGTGSKVA